MRLLELDNRRIQPCDGPVVDPCAHRPKCAGEDQQVESGACTVLLALIEQAGNVVDKNALLDTAWGHSRLAAPANPFRPRLVAE